MPEQPPDPRHYEMKIPSEPDQATLKKEEPVADKNREPSNSATNTSDLRGDNKPQAVRGEK